MTLDVQYAEYTKTDPIITEAMWTTRLPSNFNDGELDALSQVPIPPPTGETYNPDMDITQNLPRDDPQKGYRTDVSFSLARLEIMHAVRRYSFSKEFSTLNGYEYLSTPLARVHFVNDLVQRINQDYLQFWKGNDFLGFFERNAVKVMLSKMLIIAKQDWPATPGRLHDYVQVLEAAAGLRRTHPKRAWLVRQPVELDTIELLWRYFATQEGINHESSRVQHAWKLAEKAMESGEREDLATCYPSQWSRIQKLCQQATKKRSEQALLTEGQSIS